MLNWAVRLQQLHGSECLNFFEVRIKKKNLYLWLFTISTDIDTVLQTSPEKKYLQLYESINLKSTQSSGLKWEGRRELWPLWCVSNISPKNPCGQHRLGCSVADSGVVIFNRFPAQKEGKGVREGGKIKEKGRSVWRGADGRVSVWPGGRSNLCSELGSRSALPFSLSLSLSFLSSLVGRSDVGNEA